MEIRGRGEKKESKCSVCHISSFKCYKSFVCCYNKQRWAQLCQTLGGVPPWIDAVGKIDSKHQSCETAHTGTVAAAVCMPSDKVALSGEQE